MDILQLFNICLDNFYCQIPLQPEVIRKLVGKAGTNPMKSTLKLMLMLVMGSLPAWAALGGDVSSVNADVQVLRGQHIMVSKVGYNLHQITSADGSVVKEFVTPAGLVFGISWQGHFMPNLQQLLG